jgi:hypothetical protein
MSISNDEIFERLQELGWNPPTINDNNRMYGLALIYNAEIDQMVDAKVSPTDDHTTEGQDRLYKEQRRKINSTLFSIGLL